MEEDDSAEDLRLKDPEFVARLIEEAGFVDVRIENHVEEDVEMSLITARASIRITPQIVRQHRLSNQRPKKVLQALYWTLLDAQYE